MKRVVMAMLCLALVGSVEAGRISFPMTDEQAVEFCSIFGKLIGRYQGYLAAGETKESAAKHFATFFRNVDPATARVLLEDYFAVTSAMGLEDGEFPAAHRGVARAICLELNRNVRATQEIVMEERAKCKKKLDANDGWDM